LLGHHLHWAGGNTERWLGLGLSHHEGDVVGGSTRQWGHDGVITSATILFASAVLPGGDSGDKAIDLVVGCHKLNSDLGWLGGNGTVDGELPGDHGTQEVNIGNHILIKHPLDEIIGLSLTVSREGNDRDSRASATVASA